jgi:hypothetical protein
LCGFSSLVLLWLAASTTVPVSASDRQALVRADDLVPFFEDYSPTPAFEGFEKTRSLDGSIELTYEYDSTDENEPYISATISYEASTQDAAAAYLATWSIQQLGLNVADQNMQLKELDSFYTAGNRSRFANILYSGEPVGHLLVIQKKQTVYSYLISDYLIEDPYVWMELFNESIQSLY